MFNIYHHRGGSRFFSGDTFWRRRREASTLLTGLAAHWKLDEASGTRYDSAQAHHLTTHGNPMQVEGKVGGYATQFSPSRYDYLSTNSTPALRLNATDFTLAGWVFFDSVDAVSLLGKWQSGSREYLLACDGTFLALSVSSNGSDLTTLNGSVSLETATWYHFAAWHDTTLQTLNLAIDNGVPASASYASGVFAADSDFEMGRDAIAETYFGGRLNSVSLWKRLLTAAERTQLYNGGNGLAYPF